MKAHLVLFGIPIRFGPTILILVVLAVANVSVPALAAGLIAAFVGSVLIHELGHAVAFRRYGCSPSIVLHGFGGMTMSTNAGTLTDRQHIVVSLAGPVTQFVFLGIPSLIAWSVLRPTGDAGWLLDIMVLINVGWSLVNLLPLYPLDGGQVLFRTLSLRSPEHAWRTTKIVAVAVGVPVAYLAYVAGYTFAMLLIGYVVYQGVTAHDRAVAAPQQAPNQTERPGPDPIVVEAYRQLVAGSSARFVPLMDAMGRDPNLLHDVARIRAWQAVLNRQVVASAATPMLTAVTNLDRAQAATFGPRFATALDSPEALPAVVALRQRDLLDLVLGGMDEPSLEHLENRLVEAGLSTEQIAVARALRVHGEAHRRP